VLTVLSLAMVARAHAATADGPDTSVKTENRLLVHAIGLRNAHGDVRCSLFSSAEDFPNNGDLMARTTTAPIADRTATCEFAGIAPGLYAVVLFDDENGDGKFNRRFLFPLEGYGFTNNVNPQIKAPGFDECKFQYSGKGVMTETIKIIYR